MNITILVSGIVIFSWLAVLFGLAISIVRISRSKPLGKSIMLFLIPLVIAFLLTAVNAGLVFIQPEERGVVISAVQAQGYRSEALTPGLHWIIPFAENVVIYPISKQTYTMSVVASEGQKEGDDSITARTLDGQLLTIDASVIYMIDPKKVVDVHINWQSRLADDLVRPQARGIIRDAISQYRVEEAVSTKRLEMTSSISSSLQKKLAENGLLMVDFVLRDISFSPEYAASVEQKQVSEQQAQQAKFVVEQKKQEAEQARETAKGKADAAVTEAEGQAKARIIQAEAEVKALQMQAEVLKGNSDLLTYVYINKLSPNVQVMFLPNNAPFIFPLPNVTAAQPTGSTTTPAPSPTAVPTPQP